MDDDGTCAGCDLGRGKGGQGGGAFVNLGSVFDALFDNVACARASGDDFELAWQGLVSQDPAREGSWLTLLVFIAELQQIIDIVLAKSFLDDDGVALQSSASTHPVLFLFLLLFLHV